jgi:Uncharacterized protein conserved in bacteria (DUF2188)
MARAVIHTLRRDGLWVNEFADGTLISRHLERKKAIQAGREASERRRAEHVIHNEDGAVAGRNDYGRKAGADEG